MLRQPERKCEKMSKMSAQESLELEVKDFGPIVEAKVDLRPLTVFVGPSNTGKTYLATLIYALHRFFFFSIGERIGIERHYFDYVLPWEAQVEKLPKSTLNDLLKWAKQRDADKVQVQDKRGVLLPGAITGLFRSGFVQLGGDVGTEICRCFGIDKTLKLIRNSSKDGARIVFRKPKPISNDSQPFAHELTFDAEGAALKTTISEETPIWIQNAAADRVLGNFCRRMRTDRRSSVGRSRVIRNFEVRQLAGALATFALPPVIAPLHCPAFYLPADRTGVMHAHSVVVNALIASAPMAALRPDTPAPTLSGVLADFLEQLVGMAGTRPSVPPYRPHEYPRNLAKQIEENILGGSVRVDKSEAIGYPSFLYRPKEWKDDLPDLPLMNASSMVSELAPVVLYLRHVVNPGNVLIVEEPESHLHPGMQVEFTRQLLAVVKSGVRVIVTTHSEWLLEALANLEMSERSKTGKTKAANGSNAGVPKQIGVWLFKPDESLGGSVVKEIPLDDDSGLYPSGFSEVAVSLHNEWARLADQDEEAE